MTVSVALGLAWGALLATPFVVHQRRVPLAARVGALNTTAVARGRARLAWPRVAVPAAVARMWAPITRVVQSLARRRTARPASAALRRELPIAIDVLGVAVAAGCTPYLAVQVVAHWGPPTIVTHFESVLRRCELGSSLESALTDVARAAPELQPVVDALMVSDRLGAPIGPALARLAEEARVAVRRRAEAHARRVPVRLLFPLVFLVLPAFVLLTVVPGLAAGLSRL
jgi:Flp pilus assembly protein TadB